TGTQNSPVVYWLSVQAYLNIPPHTQATRWGWKTSRESWNDVAVYAEGTDPNDAQWYKIEYPPNHPLNQYDAALSFQVTTSQQSQDFTVHRQVADDWLCHSPHPITAAVWWGSYLGYNYNACGCPQQPAPQKPLYFWLSLWTDIPNLDPSNPLSYSKPDTLVWQYQAFNYDEVLVGYDNTPLLSATDKHEAVYRYSVRIPKQKWFYQPGKKQVYWFSVVAVYPDLSTIPYQWGWTNHMHVYNDNAVTSVFPYTPPNWNSVFWSPLFDQTGAKTDMSFILFTDPDEYAQP
ncbi:MAG: hypothetical protein MI922_01205, partial [Bacteroidales bacterium]|nr:hypothetical protein [Bacteroidales bacterium]